MHMKPPDRTLHAQVLRLQGRRWKSRCCWELVSGSDGGDGSDDGDGWLTFERSQAAETA